MEASFFVSKLSAQTDGEEGPVLSYNPPYQVIAPVVTLFSSKVILSVLFH